MLQHWGISSARAGQALVVEVVSDSGTGGLAGLRGSMEVDPSDGAHTHALTYLFEH